MSWLIGPNGSADLAYAKQIHDLEAKVIGLESQLAAAQSRIAELDPPWVVGRDPEAVGEYEVTVVLNGQYRIKYDTFVEIPGSGYRHWLTWIAPLAWRPIPPVTPWKGE